jgi:hypothetical protein
MGGFDAPVHHAILVSKVEAAAELQNRAQFFASLTSGRAAQ